jgi:hypothetical protein
VKQFLGVIFSMKKAYNTAVGKAKQLSLAENNVLGS